ncbi:YeiH family protein [Profundibacterium mesophilum]|uniref:Membrane protein n=1 Tax=Profundibacterium mesophilum KAUST100406-0324 TaxID=1037889 RepID=A0A921NV40_9RHOB|nr:putative sulfate exporter family transporter [Profundibacterium mesophilum]KAF0676060.1 putative membrane protein [Profundibacterium mesophilum KAUST100406-0324]
MRELIQGIAAHRITALRELMPGVLVAVLVALAAQFVADHYGAPAMLMALLFGIALNSLSDPGPTAAGIGFTARSVLRFGVAILGARVSTEMLGDLGLPMVSLILAAVAATIGFGILAGRLIGQGPRFALLTAGAVAICGASAAMAIAAVLPKDARSERNLLFTVLGVTVLSTLAMIVYPILVGVLGFDDTTAGAFIGATVHDVAQVVGAGFSISDRAGEVATLVKLIRVSLLAPVVVLIALWWRPAHGEAGGGVGQRPPIVPLFVAGFLALAALNSLGLLPGALSGFLARVSHWSLLAAIAAVGMKTDLRHMLQVGPGAIVLILSETLFLAALVYVGIGVFGLGP